MTGLYALAAASVSAAALALFLLRLDAKVRLSLDAAAAGVALGATAAVALAPFDLKSNPLHFSPLTLAFLFAGLPEEAVKMAGFAAFLRPHWRARSARDVTLASGALALGFAGLENFLYFVSAGAGWAGLALERAVTATPFHVLLGLAGGYVVAKAPAGGRGAGVIGLGWIALACVHGAYDFAVFASAPAAARPAGFDALVARLGFDLESMLRLVLIGAEAAAALGAAAALCALGPAPGRAALGWILALTLICGAALAAAVGGAAALALDAWSAFGAAVSFAALPFAIGVLSIPKRAPLSRAARRWLAGAALAATCVAASAAWVWGPEGFRRLDALRAQAQAARLSARGDFAGAIHALDRAVADAPDGVEPLSLRSQAYVGARRFREAVADLDRAIALAPKTAALHAQRAEVNRERNDPAAALPDYDSALKLDAGNVSWLALRAQVKIETGDSKGAYSDLAEASKRAPNAPLVRRIFAYWDVDAGDLDAALRDLNARLHDDPRDGEAAFQRGRVHFYRGEFALARDDFAAADRAGTALYPALWLSLTQARLHEDADAALRRRLVGAPAGWPAPVAKMLLGEIDAAAARAQASNDEERCEADFYFAASRLGQDSSEASAARLRAALAECPTTFIEYEGAQAELRRLAL